jgi:hypothetical protein
MRITKTAISGLAIALAYVASPATAQTTATAPTAAAEVDQNAAIATFSKNMTRSNWRYRR